MNEVERCIRQRRSTPKFRPDPVPEELIGRIIEAGLWAPSGRNRQSPIVLAITNREVRDGLARENARIMGAPETLDPFYGAPVVLVVLADRTVPTAVYDGSATIENMLLAAKSMGLGSHWIHRAEQEFDEPECQELLKKAGAEGDYVGIGHVVVGYVDGEEKKAPERKEGRIFWVR